MTEYATASEWVRFLRPLVTAVRNPPTESDLRGRCIALSYAARVKPEWMTEAYQREACRKFDFWPSVAEVEGLWRDHKRDMTKSRDADALPALPGPTHQPPTAEERAAILAKAAAAVADIRAAASQANPRGTRQVEARPIHPTALLAQYEALAADGNQAAATRASQLRKALCAAQEGA